MIRSKTVAATALGAGVTAAGAWGLMLGEVLIARRAIGVSEERPPSPDGTYGADLPGEPVRCLVLGDSAAVGYGMKSAVETPPALIGEILSRELDSPVEIRSLAAVGARSSDLAVQVATGLPFKPDVAIIVIGTNDVTHRVPVARAIRQLIASVERLVDVQCEVVVGTVPDLGTIRPIPQPLRAYAQRQGSKLARAQLTAVAEAGGRAVSMGEILGELFYEQHEQMFGEDRFHPSAAGYANMVSILVPSAAAAIRDRRRLEAEYAMSVEPRQTMSLADAVTSALARAGTEVTRAGRFANVLRRRRTH